MPLPLSLSLPSTTLTFYYLSSPLSYSALMNSEAYITLPLPSSETIPTCLAIFDAVILLSPVTMITLIPATLQLAIADFDYSLGGSSIPKTPIRVNPPF